jgi:hypothetical protein
MDWIERLFGISPDGGDGSAEVMIFAAIAIVLAGILAARVPSVRSYLRQWLPGGAEPTVKPASTSWRSSPDFPGRRRT